MNSYHDTTHLPAPERREAEGKARTQEEAILAYFRECYKAGTNRTPWEVCTHFRDKWPITSVRRAITNLTTAGKLEKTRHQRVGRYANKECAWVYKPQAINGIQQTLF